MRSVLEVPSHVIWKIETSIEDDTRCKKRCTQDTDASVPFKVGTLGLHSSPSISSTVQNTLKNPLLEPSAVPSSLPEFHWRFEISSLSKVVLVLGKARNCRMPNLGCRGAESPGWFDISQKNSARDVMCERAHCHDGAANHQLPIAVAVFIVLHLSTDKEHQNSPY